MCTDLEQKKFRILVVEDSDDDLTLLQEVLSESRHALQIYAAHDGIEAIQFLHQDAAFTNVPMPNLIMLDLNLPRKPGQEVLKEIKNDPALCHIPVVIFTTSRNIDDVNQAYNSYANCYITKPVDFEMFDEVIKQIEHFWIETATLPSKDA